MTPSVVVVEFLHSRCEEYPDLSRCPHGIVRLFATQEEADAYVDAAPAGSAAGAAPHFLIVNHQDRDRFRIDRPTGASE